MITLIIIQIFLAIVLNLPRHLLLLGVLECLLMRMLSIESLKKSRHALFKPCGLNYNLK